MSRGRKVGSAYPMTVLNRVFMVSSALMFVSTLWMFWDDYDRPWKKYQIKFIAMQRERAETERENLKEDQRKAADIQAKREKAEADREKNQAKIDELRQLLGAQPGQQKFRLISSPLRGAPDELTVGTRSLIQIMGALALGVEVPPAQCSGG